MTQSNRGEKFIFVGGPPRAGTTLVQNILDSHPDIYGMPEFRHMRSFIKLRNRMREHVEDGVLDMICSGEEVDEYFRTLIENFFHPLLEKNHRKLISEKTPSNVLIFPELMQLFPAARFINVVRDPRGIVASIFEVRRRAEEKKVFVPDNVIGLRQTIQWTKKSLEAGFRACHIAPERILTVVYEKLVANPKAETQRLCDFLKIPWSEQMLRPGELKHPAEKAMTDASDALWYTPDMFNRNPETTSIEKWKKVLKPSDQVRIYHAFKDFKELKDLGYNISLGNLSAPQRIAAETYSLIRAKVGDFIIRLKSL